MLKKTRRVLIVICIIAVIASICVLTACKPKHTHELQEYQKVEATCTTDGQSAYWSCEGCGKFFSDAEGKNETTLEALKIAKLGHHLEKVDAKAASCTENGNIEYWRCTNNGCGKYFSDEQGQTEIVITTTTVPATAHANVKEVKAGIDTEAKKGWNYHWYCEDCGRCFNNSFGDEELAESAVYYYPIESVSINLNGKKAGSSAAISEGSVTLTSAYEGVTAEGIIADGVLTLSDVYPIAYEVACDKYIGFVTFEAGKTEYDVELMYEAVKVFGEGADSIDRSHMADSEPYISIKNKSGKIALAELQDIGELGSAYYLQTNVKIDGTFSAWAEQLVFIVTDGNNSTDEGVTLWMSLAANNIHICRYQEHGPDGTNTGYDGKDNNVTSPEMCSQITSSLYSEAGLNVRVLRNGGAMTLFYQNSDGNWVRFYSFGTCGGNPRIAIGVSANTGTEVVFSNYSVEKLTHVEMVLPVEGTPGKLEHYVDANGNLYDTDGNPVVADDITISKVAKVEDSSDGNIIDNASNYWKNLIYSEVYQQEGTIVTVEKSSDENRLIGFDAASVGVVDDQYENGKGIVLDGVNKSHMKINGNGAFGDITVTVGNNAKSISVWTGAWLAQVRVSLYESGKLYSVAEFNTEWDPATLNKLITFDVDTSDLEGEATKAYTLKIEYLSSVATANEARVRLAGIAVFGEERELTHHEEAQQDDGSIVIAHYTDSEGNYYTEDKILINVADLTIVPAKVEDSRDVNLNDANANHYLNPIYWEVYTFVEGAQNIQSMADVSDLISFDFSGLTIYDNDGGQGVKLNGSSTSPFRIPGTDGAYGDITVTVGKDAKRIAVWSGTWLAKARISLYQNGKRVSFAEIGNTGWDPSSVNQLVMFDVDTSELEGDATKTYTIKIEYLGGVAGADPARIRLSGIAVLGEEVKLTYHNEEGQDNGSIILAHYTDAEGNYYNEEKVIVNYADLITFPVKVEDSCDVNLTDADANHYLNPIYWEVYTFVEGAQNIQSMADVDDLISFDFSGLTIYSDDGGQGVKLNGSSTSPFRIPGTDGAYGDITVKVGKDAKRIAVWSGTWLAQVRISLYQNGERFSFEEIGSTGWDPSSTNKLLVFNIDTSDLEGDATKTYTIKIEYLGGVAGADPARIRLSAIAVLGEEIELTHHDKVIDNGKIVAAHYTDAEGNYYTDGKVLTTLEALTNASVIEDASNTDLSKTDAIYYEIYKQDDTTGSVTEKSDATDFIGYDVSGLTLTACQGENAQGVALDGGENPTHISIDGNGSLGEIAITITKDVKYIEVYVSSWLATVDVELLNGETSIAKLSEAGIWGNWNKVFTIALDGATLAADGDVTLTLKVSTTGEVSGNAANGRVHLSGIAIY